MGTSNSSITFKGDPLTVSGTELQVGEVVPDFNVVGGDMSEITLGAFQGKVLIILSVPSLDTPVCAIEAKRFNEEAAKLAKDVSILVVSRDLPFAQQRWCGAEGVERLICASDYKQRTFGKAFGTDIEAMGLLARAVFVVGKDGKLAHVDYVPEIAEETDYEAALAAVRKLV
jgi:thiol peroxidase